MRNVTLPILLAASLAMAAPARAQTDLGDVVSGIAQQLIAKEADKRAYLQAQQQNTVRGYRSYLSQYPTGVYRENAQRALVKLGAVEDPAPKPPVGGGQSAASVEASLGLSRSQRVLIQKQLTAVGYPTGVADGLWGAKTRDAIGSWQRKNKQSITGYVTARQVNLLAQQAGSVVGPGPAEPSAGNDALEESLLNLSYAERREVQRRLTTLGYNTYGVDGGFGANTRRAMAAWQRDEGLRASGYLTADQLRSLRQQTGG
ncbi:peptidoglycan-binding protein [Cypionkella aquatica]|uniref:Peptidoglycan-binding protein n=1 Tax=Cypionkella aquatica TaxID=1756042 RepID=A0AA37U3Y3_9RHOB|nr:peptidoglycan-binding domain-containing protein [Cypionkella aquatica]GLS85541.1 peptidoglycan-binding protein [Cypionkella aquatica]